MRRGELRLAGRRFGWASAVAAASLLAAAPQAGAGIVRLTSDPSAGHPDITVDRDGTAHVVWNERGPGEPGVLVYCRVPRGGRSCSPAQRFELPGSQTFSGDHQRVVISPAGEVILVSTREFATGPGPTYVVTSSDGGSSFAGPREISDLGGSDDWEARFGPGDFSLSLAQAGCFPGVRYQAAPLDSTTEGAAALTPFTGGGCGITTPWLGSPSIAFVDPLTPLVAFRVSATEDARGSDSEIYFRRWGGAGSYNDASNWTPARLVSRGDGTRLASGPRGVYLMYHDPRAQGAAVETSNYWVRRYHADPNAFGGPTRVSRPGRGALNDVGGDLLQDAGGNLHAVFTGRDPRKPKEVRHRVSRDGASWGPIRVLATHRARLSFDGELRVGAARDGGGAVVARGSGPSAAADGIYLLTFAPVADGGDPGCPERVTVGLVVVRALEGCLRRDGSRYTTGRAVKVNGIDIEPRAGGAIYRLTLDTKAHTLETRGEANVRVGKVVLDRGPVAWKLPEGEGRLQRLGVADGTVFRDLGRFAKTLFSFPVDGDAELRVEKRGEGRILTDLRMPKLLGGVTGAVTLRTTDQGLVLQGFRIKVPAATIGKLRIGDVDVTYEADPDVFLGKAKFQVPPAYGPPFQVELGFREGRLNLASFKKEFTDPIPIVGVLPQPIVGLDELGFSYIDEPGSRKFQGTVGLQGGPLFRGLVRISELDGAVTLEFPPSPKPATIDASGVLKVVGIPFATGQVRYSTDNLFTFNGTFQLPPPGMAADIAKVDATVDGFLALRRPYPFSAHGAASATVAGISARGEAVISSKGVSACIRFPDLPPPLDFVPDIGVSWRWGDPLPELVCNVGPFKLEPPGPARAAQAGQAIAIPGGLRQAALEIAGEGGAPRVTVTAPDGSSVTSAPQPVLDRRFIAQEFAEAQKTYVSIGEPPGGRYTIQTEAGSPAVKSIGLARGLPDPKVTAKVTGKGRTRTLRYRVRKIAGQRVTLAEQSAGGLYREVARTRKARGRIRFHPTNSRSRRRQIFALVEQNGYPRAKLAVARFTAPKPRRLSRPTRVRVRRKGKRLIVRWSKVKRAHGYEVRINLPRDGRRLLRFTARRKRRLAVGGLERNDRARVVVRAIDDAANPGKPRKARLRPKPRGQGRRT
jgi:hypothetical protein